MRQLGITLFCGAIMLSLVGMSVGQQPGKGKGGFGGGKGGFGGVGGFIGGGGGNDPVSLLNRKEVKEELGIDDAVMDKVPEAVLEGLGKVLNDKQVKRLRQISIQARGTQAFRDPKIQSELKFTDDQKDNVDNILKDSAKEMAELRPGGGGGGFDPAAMKEMMEKLTNLRKETNDKVLGVLTADQRKTWKQMIGDEFKLQQGFGGGFGGGFGRKKTDN